MDFDSVNALVTCLLSATASVPCELVVDGDNLVFVRALEQNKIGGLYLEKVG